MGGLWHARSCVQKSDPRWRKRRCGSFTCSQSEDYTGTLSDTLLKGSFAESLGLLKCAPGGGGGTLLGGAGPHLASAWGRHLPVAHREMRLHTGSCVLFDAERETGKGGSSTIETLYQFSPIFCVICHLQCGEGVCSSEDCILYEHKKRNENP